MMTVDYCKGVGGGKNFLYHLFFFFHTFFLFFVFNIHYDHYALQTPVRHPLDFHWKNT